MQGVSFEGRLEKTSLKRKMDHVERAEILVKNGAVVLINSYLVVSI